MKSLFPAILLSTSLIFCDQSFAAFKSDQEILLSLKKYSAADMKQGNDHMADVLLQVNDAVQYELTHSKSTKVVREILRVSLLTLNQDPTLAVADILAPLYSKDKKFFENALQSLPKSTARTLLKAIKNSLREEKSGNG